MPPPTKKVKLSSLVDTIADAELVPLLPADVRAMFDSYTRSQGGPPSVDVEPTAEQLGAVKQLPPYVDFSLFGPHGRRLLKRLTFTQFAFHPDQGSWSRHELPGPQTSRAG